MKAHKTLLLIVLTLLIAGGFGCGGDEPEVATKEAAVQVEPAPTERSLVKVAEIPADAGELTEDWTAIIDMIDNVITRLSYRDKSGLYENEFRYLRDQETFDEYIKRGEVIWANTDSLDYIEIRNITFYDRDSALIDAYFHNVSGDESDQPVPQPLMAYYHDGRWIRPYVSTIDHEREYEDLIRQADEEAEDDW
jgi:hypothetical protein